MDIYFFIFCYLGIRCILEYRRTRKSYKLLPLIPIIGVIIVEFTERLLHKPIGIIIPIVIGILYFVFAIMDWSLDRRDLKEKEL